MSTVSKFVKKVLNIIGNIFAIMLILSGFTAFSSEGILVLISFLLLALICISFFRNFLVKKNIGKFKRILIYIGIIFLSFVCLAFGAEPVSDDEFNGISSTETAEKDIQNEEKTEEDQITEDNKTQKEEKSSDKNNTIETTKDNEQKSNSSKNKKENNSKTDASLNDYTDTVAYAMLGEYWQDANKNDIEITDFAQRKNVLKLVKIADIGNILNDSIQVKEFSTLFSDSYGYKKTLEGSNYYYYGDLDKDSRPDGWGILFEYDSNGMDYIVKYLGEFEEGYFDGYGIRCNDAYIEGIGDVPVESVTLNEDPCIIMHKNDYYEGHFKDGLANGDGIHYMKSVNSNDYSYSVGEFKDDTWNGEMKSYRGNVLVYDGETKDGNYHGKGTEFYYSNGKIKYEGEFVDSEYQGKGTLYDEEGNIIHKGEFIEGDIK